MACQILFSGENMKNINLSSAEFLHIACYVLMIQLHVINYRNNKAFSNVLLIYPIDILPLSIFYFVLQVLGFLITQSFWK